MAARTETRSRRSMTGAGRGYEFFDHTADVGIRAKGTTLEELFVRMARGLTELIAEDSGLQPRQSKLITLTSDGAEELLLAWLQELLFWFSTERFLPVQYTLSAVTQTALMGTVRGDVFDPARHVQGREVKAITRHQLRVRQVDNEWEAEVIVDI